MDIVFDFEKLGSLLKRFYTISGVRYSLVDPSYQVIFASNDLAPFCAAVNALPKGHARCVACDANAARSALASGVNIYRCHAGAVEVVLPVVDRGQTIAYMFFGQMLVSEESVKEQWQTARQTLDWHPDPDSLKELFFQLKQHSTETIEACAAILQACSSYISLEGVVKTTSLTDFQRLKAYVDANYAGHITVGDAMAALSMSKTKLCALAAKQNTTFTRMLNEKRVEAAQDLLLTTDNTISQIAGAVGVNDYSYFTKLFRAQTGVTPQDYRKMRARSKSR